MLTVTQDHLDAMQDSQPTYQVKAGDTLGAIAEQHGVSLKELIESNPQIKDPSLIHPGDHVNLPESANCSKQTSETASDKQPLVQACGEDAEGEPIAAQHLLNGAQNSAESVQPLAHVIMPIPGTTDPLNTKDLSYEANGSYWDNTQTIQQLRKIDDEGRSIALNHGHYSWSGDNSVEARGQNSQDLIVNALTDAGQRLKQLLYARDDKPFYQGMLDKPMHFHFIGHSHGGNVMNEFTHAIKEDFPPLWKIKSLTYLSTPFFNYLHPLDTTHFHEDAKILLVHNDYDITQHFIANYSVINLEDIEVLLPKLKAFINKVKQVFVDTLSQIASVDNLILLADWKITAYKWKELGKQINNTAMQLTIEWQKLSKELQDHHRIVPFTLPEFFRRVVADYSDWASAVNTNLSDQADEYLNRSLVDMIMGKDFFNLETLYSALEIPRLLRIVSTHLGRNAQNSPLFDVLDDFVSGIISVFDDTKLKPNLEHSNLPASAVKVFDVSNKDSYHSYGQKVFKPFLQLIEKNQQRYRQAVEHPNVVTDPKSIRLQFIMMLLAQMDHSVLRKLRWLSGSLNYAEWAVYGELDSAIKDFRTSIDWVLKELDKYHQPLMVSEDLLLHYTMLFIKAKNNDKKGDADVDDLADWIDDNVYVDKDRVLKSLEKLAPDDDLPVKRLVKKIESQAINHKYRYKDDELDKLTLRGSIEYLAVTSHSISREKLYEQDPDIKGFFESCLED